MSGGDKDLQTDGLALIAKGLTDALGELKELGMVGSAGAGRGFSDIALSGMELGHEGLTGEFTSFCERWEWGVRSLVDETGNTVRLRIHDKDGTAPAGSNAANGDVYRISIGGRYQDEAGNLHHRQVHNPNSPHHNPDAANRTHIPWPNQYPLPY
ncbi:polymorphic toxin type 30 domain-containing protein [Streptomyces sp. 900105245]